MTSPIEFKLKFHIKRSAKEERYEKCKETFFKVFNWVAMGIIACFSFFTGVSQTNLSSWNMTLYCDSNKFNQQLTPVSKKWAIISIFTFCAVLVAIMSIKMIVFHKVTKDLKQIVDFFLGFLLSWDIVYVLQNVFSYPIPSFYRNEKLNYFYCCKNCPGQKATSKLLKLDMESRGSFPSFLMCSMAYTTTYFFLFLCYLDTTKSFSAKILFLTIPSLIGCTSAIQLWQNHENHLEDIICGAVIGILLASFIMRDLIKTKSEPESWRFKEDFVSVLIAREMEFGLDSSHCERGDNRTTSYNQYTINLYPHAASLPDDETPVISQMSDDPPPYSSL